MSTALYYTCRFQNPNIPRADRVGAARRGGVTWRGRAEQNADGSGSPEANRPSSHPD